MSRRRVDALGLAISAGAGAWLGVRHGAVWLVPLWVAVAGLVLALAALRRVGWVAPLYVGVAIVTLSLAQRSMAGLEPPSPTGPVQAEVTLLTDPAPTAGGSIRAEVSFGGRRLSAIGHRSAAAALDDRLAGERIVVRGRLLAPGRYELAMRHRHLAGRLAVETVMGWRPGHAVTRAANGLRRTLDRGAASLPERQRSLLMGLTLGDDRHQPADLTDAFRAAGLGHLTAASGQNVAFVLAMAGPVLMRARLAPRLVVTLGLLAGFALLTRGEPSVLRATAMAAVAAGAAATGRPTSSLRALGLAVTGVLMCDPLLVSSLGFQLSVAGAAGIVVGAAPLQRWLPGPRWATLPLAVTCAAQLAVAPLLVGAFGPQSLASVPANVLAAPAAGPVMVWGLIGGLVAGMVGEPFASLLHLPTRILLTWIETVAFAAARWPLGQAGPWHIGVLGLAVGLVAAASSIQLRAPAEARALRLLGVGAALAVVAAAVTASPASTPRSSPSALGAGMVLWSDGAGRAALAIDGRATDSELWSGLRRAGVRRVDLVLLRTGATRAIATAEQIRRRWPATVIVAPPSVVGLVAGAVAPPPDGVVGLGGLRLHVSANSGRLSVTAIAGPGSEPYGQTEGGR